MMFKNTLILWIVGWSAICFGSDPVAIVNWGSLAHSKHHAQLQTFFAKEDNRYVHAARFITSRGIKKNIKDFAIYDTLSPVKLEESNSIKKHDNGLYVLYEDPSSRQCWSFNCKDSKGNEEEVFVKRIHHTGTTEKLLDMPECSVTLHSDSVKLSLNDTNGRYNSLNIFSHQTIIDPDQVKSIRECIKSGKIFVVNVEGNLRGVAPYKVLQCKNDTCIHWDGWWPIQFFWKCVGKNLELNGFDKAEDVKPEEEIQLDLKKNYERLAGYKSSKNLRKTVYMFIGLCIAFKLYESLK